MPPDNNWVRITNELQGPVLYICNQYCPLSPILRVHRGWPSSWSTGSDVSLRITSVIPGVKAVVQHLVYDPMIPLISGIRLCIHCVRHNTFSYLIGVSLPPDCTLPQREQVLHSIPATCDIDSSSSLFHTIAVGKMVASSNREHLLCFALAVRLSIVEPWRAEAIASFLIRGVIRGLSLCSMLIIPSINSDASSMHIICIFCAVVQFNKKALP